MANDYTTSTDAFQDISEGSFSSSDYPQMATFVTAASRLIDLEVGRWEGFFYPTTDSAIRYYDGSGCDEQQIDEFVSISEVAVSQYGGVESTDYTAFSSSDFYTWPYNSTGNAKPITKLIIDVLNGSQSHFDRYRKSVRVTGIPGYSVAVPSVIAHACRMQSVRYFMRAKQAYQDTGASAEIGGLTFTQKLTLDPDVKQLLHPFKLELDR